MAGRSDRHLEADAGFHCLDGDHLDGVPRAAVEEGAVRALAGALLAADAQDGVDLDVAEGRVVNVADCMYWVPDLDHQPFGHIEVDPVLCIGCKKCTSKGPDGAFLDGCPWDAIEMVAIEEVEARIGFKMTV